MSDESVVSLPSQSLTEDSSSPFLTFLSPSLPSTESLPSRSLHWESIFVTFLQKFGVSRSDTSNFLLSFGVLPVGLRFLGQKVDLSKSSRRFVGLKLGTASTLVTPRPFCALKLSLASSGGWFSSLAVVSCDLSMYTLLRQSLGLLGSGTLLLGASATVPGAVRQVLLLASSGLLVVRAVLVSLARGSSVHRASNLPTQSVQSRSSVLVPETVLPSSSCTLT